MESNAINLGSAAAAAYARALAFIRKSPARMVTILALAMFLITGAFYPSSLNQDAVVNIMTASILLSIAAAGQTMVLISGGLDFSVGAVMSASAIMTAYIMKSQDGMFFPVLALCLAMGALIGLVNGFCTVKIGLPAMIVTMAISNVVSRMQYVFTEGSVQGRPGRDFVVTVVGRFFGNRMPNALLYAALIYPIVFFLLNFSRFGRQVYLVGNNPAAANLNGVKVNKIRILTYMFSGMLAAFAGMLGCAFIGTARCDVFNDYAFTSLVAVIVGGTSFSGGLGRYTGSIAGALLITVLSNSLTIFQLTQPARNIINGLIMVLLLVIYSHAKSVRQ
ncbi:MAG: ABC transporter permease [Oscillospiraceae bacterium]|nr:ABC transporter permease [Oscillospiraceae bacterium]